MEDAKPTPPPEDLHWGVALRLDIQEIRQDIRELRREAAEHRKEMVQQFAEIRSEMAQQIGAVRQEMAQQIGAVRQEISEVRQDLRHSLMAMLGFQGVLTAILVAFIQYRLGPG